jgi:hypothetical protein
MAKWDIPNSTIAGLALIGKTIYFTTIDSKALQIPQLNSIKTLNIDQPDKISEDLIAKNAQKPVLEDKPLRCSYQRMSDFSSAAEIIVISASIMYLQERKLHPFQRKQPIST